MAKEKKEKKVKKINQPVTVPENAQFEKNKKRYFNQKVFVMLLAAAYAVVVLALPIFKVENDAKESLLFVFLNNVTLFIPHILDTSNANDIIDAALKYGLVVLVGVIAIIFGLISVIRGIIYFFKGFNKKKAIEHVNKEFYGNRKQKRVTHRLHKKSTRWVWFVNLYVCLCTLIPASRIAFEYVTDPTITKIINAIFFYPYIQGVDLLLGGITIGLGILVGLCSNSVKKTYKQYKQQYL